MFLHVTNLTYIGKLNAGLEEICLPKKKKIPSKQPALQSHCKFIRLVRFLLSTEGQSQKLAPLILQIPSRFPSKCGSAQPFPGDMIILLNRGV